MTYLLTIEPTASFWDCPEFISQGAKLEVGHPPGNPIFMLTARFFVTIFGGDITRASIAVNSMSALLSAATILLLFWTITHLIRKIIVDDKSTEVSLRQMLLIFGGGLCGALAYTWSDTFWFSAVEGEVYAFSSFCTALVFWLILKWENHADEPGSDRYLILIAYVIGVSIAVHLLNLLCIPAIVLVFYYRKSKETTAKGSLISLGVSFVMVGLILFGLVPGFVKVAQAFELFFVNTCGMSYNSGTLIYAVLLVALFALTIHRLYSDTDGTTLTKLLVLLVAMLSGLTFMTGSVVVWIVLTLGAAIYLIGFCNPLPRRVLTIGIISVFVIFIGYSSYALLLIRASADTPMNQNAPDNVFTLSSYLNREQYGRTPLLYGPVFTEEIAFRSAQDGEGNTVDYAGIDYDGTIATTGADVMLRTPDGNVVDNGVSTYSKVAKNSPDEPDRYVKEVYTPDYDYSSDAKMLFSRMYSTDPGHIQGYKSWSLYSNPDLDNLDRIVPADQLQEWVNRGYVTRIEIMPYLKSMTPVRLYTNSSSADTYVWKPTMADNIRYFLNYQLNHMYWRYFMWNFAGRQNDLQGNGEPHLGNWISGIPFIDNTIRGLGDQSLLPAEYSTGNKGHNVFYMLPLLMGLIGLLWQSLFHHKHNPKRGIEQFWVVFFLFFMTGIAIVLYLNQTPGQPRERDYAFAGSFYAFAIWIGMGVPAISILVNNLIGVITKKEPAEKTRMITAGVAVAVGILVPLQMVSQTWDDHDRSHRYTTRDFGENYLNSLEPNAIIFTNGDNDTFPLWYAQEVEGVRTDVRVVNLSYLSTDWYANQLLHPYYDAEAVKFLAKPTDYAYDKLAWSYTQQGGSAEALEGLKAFYESQPVNYGRHALKFLNTPEMYMPVDSVAALRAFDIDPQSTDSITKLSYLAKDINSNTFGSSGFGLNKLLSYDIVANSVADGFSRPVYFATTVPNSYYLGLEPYLYMTGLAYQVTPFNSAPISPMAEKSYENIVSKFRWGGLDDPEHNTGLYLDETVRRMVSTVRNSLIETATELYESGELPASKFAVEWAKQNGQPVPANRYDMSRNLLNLLEQKLPEAATPFESYTDMLVAMQYMKLYNATGNTDDYKRAEAIIDNALDRYAQHVRWGLSMHPGQLANLGSGENIVRYQFPMFMAFKELLEMSKTLHADPVANKEDIDLFDSLVDSSMRVYVYPYVFVKGSSPSELLQVQRDFGGGMDMSTAVVMAEMFDRHGVDRKKVAADMAAKYGFVVEQLMVLNPYVR